MKHIKEYKDNKILDLADYLQEIFDEFNVKYKDYGIKVNEEEFYCDVNSGCIYITMYSERSNRMKYYGIKNRLEERHKYLEDRIGRRIRIEYWGDEIEISID